MEEQKKTQGEAGGDSLFDGGFDTAVPERPWATLKRLWHTAQDQHLRLLVVVLSVVCYTALAIAAPYYSAGIVDLLWENIQRAQGLGEAFVVTWLNPQALIDGTLLFGSFRVGHPGADSTLLVMGSATASCLWFSGVTLVISLFSARFNDRILRAVNIVCGSVILAYGLRLILQFIRSI